MSDDLTTEGLGDDLAQEPQDTVPAVAEGESAAPIQDQPVDQSAQDDAAPATDQAQGGQADESAPESADADAPDQEDAGQKAVDEFSKKLRTLEGKWYVLHTYSGYEKRVKANVESRIVSFGLEDQIFQVEIPMEEVEKHTDKGKKVVTRVRVAG